MTPVSRALPSSPLTLNISRTCSLIRYPVYRCRLSRLIPASAVRCLPVRFSGFFRKAHRPEPSVAAWSSRPAARSSAARRRRSPSSFSPAHFTTWNASTLIRAWGAFARTTSWIHSAPSADTSVSILARSGPRSVKNFSTVAWQRPSPIQAIVPASWSVTTIRYWSSRLPQDFSSIPIRASPSRSEFLSRGLAAALAHPGDRAGVVVGDDDQVLVFALAPGFLVDPDPRQPVQPVPPCGRVRTEAPHDAAHRTPGDAQLPAHFRPRPVRGQPRRMLLERHAEPVIMTGPRHRGGDLPVLHAHDPGQARFQETPLPVHVQGPPPAGIPLHRVKFPPAVRA